MRKLSEEPPPEVLGGGLDHSNGQKKIQNRPLFTFFANFFRCKLDVLEILQCSPQREDLDLLQLHAQLALRLAAAACSTGSLRLSVRNH